MTPLTPEHVNAVFENPWERARKEAEVFGNTIEDERQRFLAMAGQPFAVAVLDNDDSCACLICLEPRGPFFWRAFFMATEEGFKRVWMDVTKLIARLTDRMITENGHTGKIEIISHDATGRAHDWFRVMGFRYAGADTTPDTHRFVKEWR